MSIKLNICKSNILLAFFIAGSVTLIYISLCHSIVIGLLFGLLFFLSCILRFSVNNSALNWIFILFIAIFSAILNFLLAQMTLGLLPEFSQIGLTGKTRYVLNILCYIFLIFAAYTLVLNIKTSSLLSFIVTLSLATVNYYVVLFRGSELKLADIFALQAALNVVESYQFSIAPHVVISWLFAVLWHFFLFKSIQLHANQYGQLTRVVSLFVSIACIFVIFTTPPAIFHKINGLIADQQKMVFF